MKIAKKIKGFTLLEVLLSIAIVGIALGSIFGLLSGSKRLAFKASDEMGQVLFLRSVINIAQLEEESDYPELPEEYKKDIDIDSEELLEPPDQQTQKILLGLEPYTLINAEKHLEIKSIRLKILDSVH
jgi:prepilin-type N-terminal cleavage/methylation domain-containing protein